jgi:hypothetical protein
MATRSRIAIENQDGSVISIYCHWDGHIETNGKILFENYDKEKTEQLIALGNISVLGALLEPTGGVQSFNSPEKGVTVAYHRDRKEDLMQKLYLSVEDLYECGFNSGEEYVYCLTKDNIWLVGRHNSNNVEILKEALEEIEA